MDHEPDEAKKYWASVPFDAYHRDGPQRTLIADALEALRRHGPVESVLEFGCSVGRNLETLRRRLSPPLELVGLDINRSAVEDGKARYGLDLRVGDESVLRELPSARFDCSFTVSVLDHVADVGRVEAIIAELVRLTRTYLVLLEPFAGWVGRAGEEFTRFNYYWDYPELFRRLGVRLVTEFPYALGYRNPVQRSYRLYVAALTPGAGGLGRAFVARRRLERLNSLAAYHVGRMTERMRA